MDGLGLWLYLVLMFWCLFYCPLQLHAHKFSLEGQIKFILIHCVVVVYFYMSVTISPTCEPPSIFFTSAVSKTQRVKHKFPPFICFAKRTQITTTFDERRWWSAALRVQLRETDLKKSHRHRAHSGNPKISKNSGRFIVKKKEKKKAPHSSDRCVRTVSTFQKENLTGFRNI